MNEKVQIIDLKKSFSGKEVLTGASLEVKEGEICSIIGKSGSGKSVILKHLIGLIEPDSGEIFVDNVKYTGADASVQNEHTE